MQTDRSKIFVVIAAYNEASVVSGVVSQVRAEGYPVIAVDDGSRDNTAHEASRGGAITILHPFNLGQGAALQTGIEKALASGAEVIVTFDADGQHSASDIARMVETLERTKSDFVLGSRFIRKSADVPPMRRLLLKAATIFTRFTTGLALTDAHNGLRAMTRRGAQAIRLRQNRMAHASEFLSQVARSSLPYVEHPVNIQYTSYSLSKGQRAKDSVVIVMDLLARALYR